MSARETGQVGENLAVRYLQRQGLRILSRNFSCRRGEIDLIAADGDELVFVEVRYRGMSRISSGEATVTPAKQRRIVAAASFYLSRHQAHDRPCRFDVLGINRVSRWKCDYHWIRHAFDAG